MPHAPSTIPDSRLRLCNDAPINPDGAFILYWMIACRRPGWNFGLQRAVFLAHELRKPLVILEPLRCGYRWANDRLHAFAIQGMADHARHFSRKPVLYWPYVEPDHGAGSGLLRALAAESCAVVTDDFPCFFLPRMVAAAARKLPVRIEEVDSNGLWPVRATGRVFTTAHSFRAFLQKNLARHLLEFPEADPLANVRLPRLDRLPAAIEGRWPKASEALLAAGPAALKPLPIEHAVPPSPIRGGYVAGRQRLVTFLQDRLPRYLDRNDPDSDAASGLSPYLHWGHLSSHEVFQAVVAESDWTVEKLAKPLGGRREGWWRTTPEAEAFLDQLVTWRELGFNMSAQRDDYDQYLSLPSWALQTLRAHRRDPRPCLYSLDELEAARTADPLWNAAQRQLLREGVIHNYLRMLWGKRVLEWTRTPEEAFEVLVHLNNKYALDGRDPNSYSGIAWVFGRYDRAWGPERPIFGKVRYMSSANTARKLRLAGYLKKYGPKSPKT